MSDPLGNLPSSPSSSGDPALSVAQLKAFLSAKLYAELTDGDDQVATQSIDAAMIRAESLFAVVKVTLDVTKTLHRQIVTSLAVYELFAYVGDYKGGKSHLQAATDLISFNYGNVETIQAASPAVGALRVPKRHRL
jgi:hypothetical protein